MAFAVVDAARRKCWRCDVFGRVVRSSMLSDDVVTGNAYSEHEGRVRTDRCDVDGTNTDRSILPPGP